MMASWRRKGRRRRGKGGRLGEVGTSSFTSEQNTVPLDRSHAVVVVESLCRRRRLFLSKEVGIETTAVPSARSFRRCSLVGAPS